MSTQRSKTHSKVRRVSFSQEYIVYPGNADSQAATMTLQPGGCEGGPTNNHCGADQWLYVVSGKGVAVIAGKAHALSKQTLVLIERGQNHEIRNTGSTPLKTLNFYVPPAFRMDGEPLRRGRAK